MAKRFGDIQNQIGFDLMAEDLITAILHNNPKILQNFVERPHIDRFVQLVRNNKQGKSVGDVKEEPIHITFGGWTTTPPPAKLH